MKAEGRTFQQVAAYNMGQRQGFAAGKREYLTPMPALVIILLLLATSTFAHRDSSSVAEHPKQGLVDMLIEYLGVRYGALDLEGDLLYVSVQHQTIYHIKAGKLYAEYPVATSSKGLGSERDSYRTPTGLHRVREKIGDDVPPFGILQDRLFTGELADPDFAGVDKDWITSRVLWLEGLEPGHNQGGSVDSHDRYIYIHGTANERSVGTASSKGCVRMLNADVIQLPAM